MSSNFSLEVNKKKNNTLPWEQSKHPDILFPLVGLQSLLAEMDWESSEWIKYWLEKNGGNLAYSSWASGVKSDWIWGLGLPFISDLKRFSSFDSERRLFGLSALPGCGKTTLGKWLESAAKELNFSLKVISLDDFYLPGDEMELAMKNNPWNVPRGLPGSHSLSVLEECLGKWLSTGFLEAPQFDKSLRGGLGDRSSWIKTTPELLVLEGWFLGCHPEELISNEIENEDIRHLRITADEKEYRKKVQKLLFNYLPIWQKIDRLWHIKIDNFSSSFKWKIEQEKRMLASKGAALQGEKLTDFIRMIQASIPQRSLMNIDSDVTIEINNSRQILNIASKDRKLN
ncbi:MULTISPECIES: uridine kinase [unclassified Prochlorococcus]|uniref:uridine kinase n=1 Tax=unclassified Prochlorococcus TaxID=2627481 RepID=UPI000533BAFA|nr:MULTISPECIES: uridine kinase [unclassified Prochlorococcus]KGG15042.1 D-glycerate 3-kinase [Prochlorococcus sp. MIT 0602]KGG17313.1 D-glycerate 3-kinase [Prochlorococcus sp. MIT 0603]